MKATVKEGIKGFSGKLDGAIYYYHPRLQRTLMRRAPKMPVQPQNEDYRAIARQIKAIDPSPQYRYDFKIYHSALMDKDASVRYPSWYSLYVKMLWAMRTKYPGTVDLKTITRQQITDQNLPCRSVKAAVEAGILAEVPGYEHLDRQI
jgi:hypothetical protein